MKLRGRGTERRQFGRRTTVIHAWTSTNGKQPTPCIVRNLSNSGALLEFPGGAPAANTFRLVVESLGQEWVCDVRHRREGWVGVYFDFIKYRDSAGRPIDLKREADQPLRKRSQLSSLRNVQTG